MNNMKDLKLFLDKKGEWITSFSLLNLLRKIGADNCNVLFIHSALTFGTPNPQLSKMELLNSIYDVFRELGVDTICVPTFTFSFCNQKVYDINKSNSRMGVFNEFFRKQPGVIRSIDPLLSVALLGTDKSLVLDIEKESIGKQSTYDLISRKSEVKFLFFGTKIGDCFTYMHYLEWFFNVDYRYNKSFTGEIIQDGIVRTDSYKLFVRYNDVIPNHGSYLYEEEMYNNGLAQLISCGDSSISIVQEELAKDAYNNCLKRDPYFFVSLKNNLLLKDKCFVLNQEMVAL